MKLTVVLIILSLAFTTLSCNDEDDFPTEKKVIELDEKSTQLVQAGNEFGFELFRNIYEQETTKQRCDHQIAGICTCKPRNFCFFIQNCRIGINFIQRKNGE